jgi:glycosyltransferase involved in cell wall biosynthesis
MTERRLKVTHVIARLELGGAETLLYRLATHDVPGVEQEVICLGKPDWYSARLEERGVTVHHLRRSSPLRLLTGAGELSELLRRNGADVVQSWLYFGNMLSALAARRPRIPVVWGNHTANLDQVGLVSRLCAYAGGAAVRKLATFVINCSQSSSDLHDRLGYSAVPNAVIHNGYEAAAFRPNAKARRTARQSLGLDDSTFVIGTIARWHADKDIPNLLQAARMAADQGVPLRCLLIGSDLRPGNRELAAAIARNRCEELVVALGQRSDIPDVARALDLHVLSSRSEAFPNTVAETMLSGTPNAVTNVGDSSLMVGDTGWIVPRTDPRSLAAAIIEAWKESVGHPKQWERRRERSRERIAENFTFERMAEAYARVWRQAAGTA